MHASDKCVKWDIACDKVVRGHEEDTQHKVPHAVEGDAVPSGGEAMAVGCQRPRQVPGAAPARGVGSPVLRRRWRWRRRPMRRWRGGGRRRRGEASLPEQRLRRILMRPSSRWVRRRGGRGRGRRGRWHRGAGDRGRASTSAIVVAVSVIDISRRRRRPSPWPLTSRPSSWPSQLSTSAVINVGHRRGRRRVGHVVGAYAYGKKGRHESNTSMRQMRYCIYPM